jgi:D-cysteine desulfhydrase
MLKAPEGIAVGPMLLFQMFPGLQQKLPHVPLTVRPTPVQPLVELGRRLGREIWIKRDDLSTPEYGGNKPRKLEFLLARAKYEGREAVMTGGGIGSNHALATAWYGRKIGMRVILELCRQPVTDHVQTNLKLFHALEAEMVHLGGQASFLLRHALAWRLRRPEAFFIPPGGSCPLGAIGYVEAGLELARQIEAGEAPRPEAVFAAAGSGGTMAGLVLGLRLGGLDVPVRGVRVATPLAANSLSIFLLALRTLGLMRRLDKSVPYVRLRLFDFRIIGNQYGPGYGHPTDACRLAADAMNDAEGLCLDFTYTAKTMAALENHCAACAGRGPLMFLHTYSANGLADLAKDVDFRDLPRPFQRYFEPGA